MTDKDLEMECRKHCTRKLGWSRDKRWECRKTHPCLEIHRMSTDFYGKLLAPYVGRKLTSKLLDEIWHVLETGNAADGS
jgi:hypothetical protein